MAKDEIKMKAEPRAEQGSSAAGRLRRAGVLPAAVKRIEGGTTLVKLDAHVFQTMLRHHANEHVLVTLDLDGKDVPVLMREVQYNVMTGAPIHVDFGEISLTKKLRISIPLYLLGEPEGVKVAGGILQHNLRTIEVDCLPMDIVEHFDVAVATLKLNQSFFVRDLKLDANKFTVITGKDVPVATVVEAVAEEVVATPVEGTAVAAGEGANPEVIVKGKKEEAEAAAAAATAAGGAAKAPAAKTSAKK